MARTLSPEAHRKALDAARDLLLAQGPDAFTVDAVAQRSGVAKTTIYRHFASAHDLMVAAIGSLIEPLPTPNTGSLRDDLLALFRSRLDNANDAKLRPLIVGLLTRYPILVWAGAALLGWVAGELIATEPALRGYVTSIAGTLGVTEKLVLRGFEVLGAVLVVLLGWLMRKPGHEAEVVGESGHHEAKHGPMP